MTFEHLIHRFYLNKIVKKNMFISLGFLILLEISLGYSFSISY